MSLLKRISKALEIKLIEPPTLEPVGKLDKYDKEQLLREHYEDKQRRNHK